MLRLLPLTCSDKRQCPVTQEDGYWAYFEVCKRLASESGWTIKKDSAGGPYAYKGTTWVGFDDYGYVSKKASIIFECCFHTCFEVHLMLSKL